MLYLLKSKIPTKISISETRLNTSCGWFYLVANSNSGGWIRVAADSVLRLTRVPATGYELRLTLSHGRLEFWRLDTTYSWHHPTADSSSGGWIRLKADSILRLTRVPAVRYDWQLILSCGWLEFYTLIYQVNLRTYSAKYIIFMVCFLLTDFSYHWSRLWLLLQEARKSFKILAATDLVAAADWSYDGWFETCDQSTTSRILTPIPPDIFLSTQMLVVIVVDSS